MTTGASLSDLTTAGKQFDDACTAFERLTLQSEELAVWQTRLDLEPAAVMQCAEMLSRDELARAERFRFAEDRRRFVVARAGLRYLLSFELEIPVAAITFRYSPRGKPLLDVSAGPVYFNISYSGDRALFAISRCCQPGVDIEFLQRRIEWEKLARRFFTPDEYAALMEIPEPRRQAAFLAGWTRKEAVIKAVGDGLALPLNTFDVSLGPDTTPRILAARDTRVERCTLYSLETGPDYVASAAAYRGAGPAELPVQTTH